MESEDTAPLDGRRIGRRRIFGAEGRFRFGVGVGGGAAGRGRGGGGGGDVRGLRPMRGRRGGGGGGPGAGEDRGRRLAMTLAGAVRLELDDRRRPTAARGALVLQLFQLDDRAAAAAAAVTVALGVLVGQAGGAARVDDVAAATDVADVDAGAPRQRPVVGGHGLAPVSYTHLTLPTIYSV